MTAPTLRPRRRTAAGPARAPRYLVRARELALALPGSTVEHFPSVDGASITWHLPEGGGRLWVYANGTYAVQGTLPADAVTALVTTIGQALTALALPEGTTP